MQVIVEVISQLRTYSGRNPHWDVIEVHARRLLNWQKAKTSGRLLDDEGRSLYKEWLKGDNKMRVVEFVVELGDFTDKDIADYKQVLKDNNMDEGFAEASAKAQDHHRSI
jgi:hypothetical protein